MLLAALKRLFTPAGLRRTVGSAGVPPSLVPIRTLRPRHLRRMAAHLKALSPDDRYLRFGYRATDAQIDRYIATVDFARDKVLGIFNRRLVLIAMAHLAYARDPKQGSCAEFGVSVLAGGRGRGFGGRLFARAVVHARNAGVGLMFIHALTENTAMLKIARRAGATVQRYGSESDAFLQLPPPDFDTRMAQIVETQFGEVDYRLKKQARAFAAVLAGMQEVRQGVRDGRHRSGQ